MLSKMKILKLLNINEDHLTAMPGISGKYYKTNPETASLADSHSYLHIIGSVMYEMTQTQSNYAF